jgi:murein DD-endopeptidase MepM/ murein hydrolase activator NlpD
MAAGNGTIEEAGHKGQLGTYVRILHANGYKTAYGHMSRLAPGTGAGAKVRQGQVIGYLPSTAKSVPRSSRFSRTRCSRVAAGRRPAIFVVM